MDTACLAPGIFSALRRRAVQGALAIALAFLPLSLAALDPHLSMSDYTIKHWGAQDGLPHNMVHAITQDKDGFIWVTTWEGIARFNGHSFTLFDNGNIPGLVSRAFRTATVDNHGHVLFGSPQSGLWQYSRGKWQQVAAGEPKLSTLLLPTQNSNVWIGTESGLFRLDAEDRLHPGPRLMPERHEPWVNAIAKLPDGQLLVAAEDRLFEITPDLRQVHRLPLDTSSIGFINNLLVTRSGDVLLAPRQGLYRKSTSGLQRIPEFESLRIGAMLEDRQGSLWLLSAERGLLRWRNGRLETLPANSGLHGHGTRAIFEDREGQIWVGTTDGLFMISEGSARGLDTRHGLDDNYARSVLHGHDGSVWIGTAGGLNRWQNGRIRPVTTLWEGGSSSSVLALAQTSAGIWVGSYDHGVMLIDEKGRLKRHINAESGLPSDRTRALLADGDDLWIGTRGGLSRLHADGQLQNYAAHTHGLLEGFVQALYKHRNGDLWIGYNQGLCVLPPTGKARCFKSDQLPAQSIFDFLETGEGEMLIASDHGLLRWDGIHMRRYGRQHGFPNESLFRLLADEQGMLWLSSNNGVFRIDPKQLDEVDLGQRTQLSIPIFTHGSGMPSSQANGGSFPAGAMDDAGNFWVPTAAGLAIINTRIPAEMPQPAIPIAIEEMLVNGEPHAFEDARKLHAGESRRIVIQYAGLNFHHTGELYYRYRLRGFDDAWVDVGKSTEAVFTNLPAGDFVFEVQAMIPPIDWSKANPQSIASIPLHLTPTWWKRSEAQLAATIAMLALLFGIQRLRERNLRRQRQRLEQQVKQRTRELREKNLALEEASRNQAALMQRLEILAGQDDLTRLPNRRSGRARMNTLCQQGPIRVAVLDLDHFKRINDRHGHETGDRALHTFARILHQHAGEPENCARLGGEEFALIIPDGDAESALALCETIRSELAKTPIESVSGDILYCTVSIGLSSAGQEPHKLLREADNALYRAKYLGRNQVCLIRPDSPRMPIKAAS